MEQVAHRIYREQTSPRGKIELQILFSQNRP